MSVGILNPTCVAPTAAFRPALRSSIDQRFVFVDGLRGIGALWVLYFHILDYHPLHLVLRETLPKFLVAPAQFGGTRVAGFFVLSGFVIAHSVRRLHLSPSGIGRFVLRRHIRLDPTYWMAIAFSCSLLAIEKLIPHTVTPPFHRPVDLFLNAIYVQKMVGVREVIMPAWTLCIEVQLYVLFILILVIAPGRLPMSRHDVVQRVGWAPIFAFILAIAAVMAGRSGYSLPGWCIPFWPHFACGVLSYWALSAPLVWIPFSVLTAGLLLTGIQSMDVVVLVTAGVGVLLYLAGRMDRLTSWLGGSVFRYFGRISYSLYLFHMSTLFAVMRLGYKITGDNHVAAVAWLIVAIACCIAVAHVVNVWIEKPSMRLSARLKDRSSLE